MLHGKVLHLLYVPEDKYSDYPNKTQCSIINYSISFGHTIISIRYTIDIDTLFNNLELTKDRSYENRFFLDFLQPFQTEYPEQFKILSKIVNNDNNKKKTVSVNEIKQRYVFSPFSVEEKISELEKKIDSLYVEKQSEGGLLLEIEHLKDDNLRLLQMLKSTNEFKDFAYLSETEAGGVRFCKPASAKKAATPSATNAKGKGIPNSKKDILKFLKIIGVDTRFISLTENKIPYDFLDNHITSYKSSIIKPPIYSFVINLTKNTFFEPSGSSDWREETNIPYETFDEAVREMMNFILPEYKQAYYDFINRKHLIESYLGHPETRIIEYKRMFHGKETDMRLMAHIFKDESTGELWMYETVALQ